MTRDMDKFTKTFKIEEKDYEYVMPIKAIKNAIKGFGLLGYKVDKIVTGEPMYIDVDWDIHPTYKKYAESVLDRLYKMVNMNMELELTIEKNKLWTYVYDTNVELLDLRNRYGNRELTLTFYIREE